MVDKEDPAQRVAVLYRGTVPDQFKAGREVVVTGAVQDGTFVARNDSLITLCPSKFSDRPNDTEGEPPPPRVVALCGDPCEAAVSRR